MHRPKVGLTFRYKPKSKSVFLYTHKNRISGTTYTIIHVYDDRVQYSWMEDGVLHTGQFTNTEAKYILNSPNYIVSYNSKIKLYKLCLQEK